MQGGAAGARAAWRAIPLRRPWPARSGAMRYALAGGVGMGASRAANTPARCDSEGVAGPANAAMFGREGGPARRGARHAIAGGVGAGMFGGAGEPARRGAPRHRRPGRRAHFQDRSAPARRGSRRPSPTSRTGGSRRASWVWAMKTAAWPPDASRGASRQADEWCGLAPYSPSPGRCRAAAWQPIVRLGPYLSRPAPWAITES